MSSQIGLSQSRLDEIELRLAGVDKRPWVVSDTYDLQGKKWVGCGSRKQYKKAIRDGRNAFDGEALVSGPAIQAALMVFQGGPETTEDMTNFVAHAPDDIEDLLREVTFLRKRYRDCEIERDEMRKELLSLRVEKTSLAEKYTDIRRRIRSFAELTKECQS